MLTKEQAERIKGLAREFAYEMARDPHRKYGSADVPLIDYIDSLTDEQPQAAPGGWRLVPVEPTDEMAQAAYHLDLSYMPGQEGADRAAIYRAMTSAAPAVAEQPQPGTITAEYHQREVREAVKAAYERAAEKCLDVFDEGGCDTSGLRCADAIRAMGESDAE